MISSDTIVIGLGAMGSACVYQLAKRGTKVLGIDQFSPPHQMGSSHGDTRITRQAIGEGEEYVPLALRSHEIWEELEKESGTRLLTRTGGLIIGRNTGTILHGQDRFLQTTIDAARKFGIPHSVLSADELRKRCPQFRIEDDYVGYHEPGAGYLRPELCVQTQLELARKHGAQINLNEEVQQITPLPDGSVEVKTNKGTYKAEKAIISAGPWVSKFFPEFAGVFKVYRQVLYWFDLPGDITPYLPENCPIFIIVVAAADGIYGFPAIDGPRGGMKVAFEQYETETTPETANRDVSPDEVERAYTKYVSKHLPGLSNECIKALPCLYTVTPDSRFVIDSHPEHPQIIIASPCSGHGFKHSAAIGEALAELASEGRTRFDLTPFKISRFQSSGP
jgi:sarcosine oxidase